jgi:hypothetical protein
MLAIIWSVLETCTNGLSKVITCEFRLESVVVDGQGWVGSDIHDSLPLSVFPEKLVVRLIITSDFKRVIDALTNFFFGDLEGIQDDV